MTMLEDDDNLTLDKYLARLTDGPDKPGCSQDLGCIEECRYYEPTGSISDEEVLRWYSKEIGNIGYDQLKRENDELMKAVIKEVKRQAKAYPNHMIS